MKKKQTQKILILFFVLIAISCDKKSRSLQTDLITVNGNIKGFEGKTLYAKNINPISFHSNSILDSALVDKNGNFEFKIARSLPLLVSFTKYSGQHIIHKILQKDPDKYYYGYCSKFYTPEPTHYLTENFNIQLDWTVLERMDTFNFDSATSKNHVRFYNYYLKENISKVLYQDDGSYKMMNTETAWDEIERATKETLIKYSVGENALQDEFNHYLNTEIKLGAANQYANWYEYTFTKELEEAFSSGTIPEMYSKTINIYLDSKWNTNSVEFYKMTERFITFNLNKSNKKFKNYYPTSDRKISKARELLEPSLADKYISNISWETELINP
jgi:hypothetical protein